MTKSEIDRLARKLFIDSCGELPNQQDRYRWTIRWAIENIPAPKTKAKKCRVMTKSAKRMKDEAVSDYKAGDGEIVENPWSASGKHNRTKKGGKRGKKA